MPVPGLMLAIFRDAQAGFTRGWFPSWTHPTQRPVRTGRSTGPRLQQSRGDGRRVRAQAPPRLGRDLLAAVPVTFITFDLFRVDAKLLSGTRSGSAACCWAP
jgi:hypothetical protein